MKAWELVWVIVVTAAIVVVVTFLFA